MSDIRAPDVKEQAEKDYIDGMKYKDIAAKYNVSLNTVKSWKTRYKWDRKGVHTKEKVCTQKDGRHINNKKESKLEAVTELENSELTDKQRLFCIYYIKYFNATKAYQKAYECSYVVANVNGPRLLVNASVKNEIKGLKANKLNRVLLSEDDIFQKYIDIACTDINDFMEFGQKEVPIINPKTGEQITDEDGRPLTYTIDYAHFKDSSEVDGTLISEVSKGKDGAKIKLQDKMKALQWLSDRMDLLPTATRENLKLENQKVRQIQEKIDFEKNKNLKIDEPIQIVIKRKERED
jgi:Phage terminase, small subunit